MDAPHNVTIDMFNQLVDIWLLEHAYETGSEVIHTCNGNDYMCLCSEIEKKYKCKKCGSDILYRRAYLSLHLSRWGYCVGTGEVINPTMPYCRTCEPKINIFGCIHEDEIQHPPPAPTQNVGFWAMLGARLKRALLPEDWA